MWSVPPLRCHYPFSPGVYREPSSSAQPGSLVLSGDNLILQCHSEAGFDRFALTMDEGITPTSVFKSNTALTSPWAM
ncbi:hypothetical protein HPG69_013889 [Diceros bicornis minor]|uniref:Uncharacterized protein n=1 Tax=Diceros bicornis minor TaxID=77932 RepID=A0A7J7EMN9_DICBM|nr:hypothetical protein HPG69_013889 [Diceros bicornis minor]